MNKKVVRIGAGKGKLLGVLDCYLESLGLEKIERNRQLIHYRETENYILEICLLRWEDIKRYSNEFDMIIYGCDQWLESGKKSMIALDYFEQKNCRLSLLVPQEKVDMPLSYFKEHKIATGYPELAKDYIGIKEDNILLLSGSVEASIKMGWAESIFDIIESGETSKANGLVEYKTFVKFGAILATSKPEVIPILQDLRLIKPIGERKIIAFDGIDGSGKSSLSKYFVQAGIENSVPNVLICPYSGYIGYTANSLLKGGKYLDWAITVGLNHWRAPNNVNMIYDRSIMTFITELIKYNCSSDDILKAIEKWRPLPDILFWCSLDFDEVLERVNKRGVRDEYDDVESLKEYYALYQKAYDFIKNNTDINIIKLKTDKTISEIVKDVKMILNNM